MEIRQSDFDSIRIRRGDIAFYLRYSFSLDGEEYLPESTSLRDSYITAFFLNGSIRDFLIQEEDTLSIERTWSIPPAGELGLCFRLDFLTWKPLSHRLPCFAPAAGTDHRPFMVLGERLTCPCGIYLYQREESMMLFTDPPRGPAGQGSVGLSTLNSDEGPLLRLEMRFPPQEYPALIVGPRPQDTGPPLRASLRSAGDFRWSTRLHILVRPTRDIHLLGSAAALARLAATAEATAPEAGPTEAASPKAASAGREAAETAPAGGPPAARPSTRAVSGTPAASGAPDPAFPLRRRLERPLAQCLERHLVAEGGLHGLRVTAAAPYLSSSAGCGLSLALLKRLPDPGPEPSRYQAEGPLETALRLADFSLKGQHPSGLFFETYDLRAGRWVGLRGEAGLVSVELSAEIAHRLLLIAAELERLGLSGQRYRLAARLQAEAFLEPRRGLKEIGAVVEPASLRPVEAGLGGLELVHPLLALLRLTGDKAYSRALQAARERFFDRDPEPLRLPASRDGREADAKGIQILARAALALRQAGLTVRGMDAYPGLLLPWIYLNRGSRDGDFDPAGGILDSERRNRLLFQGYEMVFILWSLSRDGDLRSAGPVEDLVGLLTRFTARAPLGTSWYLPAPWRGEPARARRGLVRPAAETAPSPRLGPPDSRRLVREALFLMRLEEEHPEALPYVTPPRE